MKTGSVMSERHEFETAVQMMRVLEGSLRKMKNKTSGGRESNIGLN